MQRFHVRAIVSRRFTWRLMILGASAGLIVRPFVYGWRAFPWVAIPLAGCAIVILHSVMDKDLPNLIGVGLLKSPRTYIASALCIAAFLNGR